MPTAMPQADQVANRHQEATGLWHFLALKGVPLLLMLCGLAFLSLGSMLLWDANRASNWPQVEGTILSSSVYEKKQTSGRKKTFHYPSVIYSYSLDGKVIEANRLSLSDMGYKKRKDAQAIAAQYQKGDRHPVYLDPKHQGVSILRPGEDSIAAFSLWFGVGFVLVALFAFWGLPKVARRVHF